MSTPSFDEHALELLTERQNWLKEPPPDLPEFAKHLFTEAARGLRRKAADNCEKEMLRAIELLHRHGMLDALLRGYVEDAARTGLKQAQLEVANDPGFGDYAIEAIGFLFKPQMMTSIVDEVMRRGRRVEEVA